MVSGYYVIKLLDQQGNWYSNAFIENSFDAIQVSKFYRDTLGYYVKLFHDEKDITDLLDTTKIVTVRKDV